MKTSLPAGLPIVDILLLGETSYAVAVVHDGIQTITAVSSPAYDQTRRAADAVAEGVQAILGYYPIIQAPDTEAAWVERDQLRSAA